MKYRRVTAFAAACLVMAFTPSAAWADGPSGTGIAADTSSDATPEELGYTPEYAAWKEAVAAPGALGAGGFAPDGGEPPPDEDYPAAYSLDFTIFHQKKTYYCLPAVGQSIADHRWGGFTSPTVEAKQIVIAGNMGTTSKGTGNTSALNWMNNRFEDHNEWWRYVVYTSGSLDYFLAHVRFDVYSFQLPMYVRVELSSGYYTWFSSGATPHATLVTGWTQDGAKARSADPYAKTKTDGTCKIVSPYSKTPDYGCIWGAPGQLYNMSRYYLARDLDPDNGPPEWY